MRAYIPIDVTDGMLISSSIPEPFFNEPAWVSTTTYAEFAQVSVIDSDGHWVYESLQADNLGNNPKTSAAWWIKRTYTNRWRMFEWNQGDPSIATSPFSYVLRPGKRIDAISFIDLKAATLDLTVRDGIGGPVVFTIDGYFLVRNVSSLYEYLTAEFVYQKNVVTFAIPPIQDPVIYIELTDPYGTVEVGRCAFGLSIYLGKVDWNPVSDLDNYSEISWDKFGRATLSPVPSIPLTEQNVVVDRRRTNIVSQFREKANAKAAVWSGLDDIEYEYTEPLILFGVYRNFSIDISNPSYAIVSLSLKGI